MSIETPKYNHAFACNEGVRNSNGDIIVFTNGHSQPVSDKWLESGLRHFDDKKVAGVYGSESFTEETTTVDKIGRRLAELYYPGLKRNHIYDKPSIMTGPGLLATMSAAIRRDLWIKHPFSEEVSASGAGEDTEWGFYFLRKGLKVIVDPEFSVYHSHQVSLIKFFQRNLNFYYSYFLAFHKSKNT